MLRRKSCGIHQNRSAIFTVFNVRQPFTVGGPRSDEYFINKWLSCPANDVDQPKLPVVSGNGSFAVWRKTKIPPRLSVRWQGYERGIPVRKGEGGHSVNLQGNFWAAADKILDRTRHSCSGACVEIHFTNGDPDWVAVLFLIPIGRT
jgi:hypothetical protein